MEDINTEEGIKERNKAREYILKKAEEEVTKGVGRDR